MVPENRILPLLVYPICDKQVGISGAVVVAVAGKTNFLPSYENIGKSQRSIESNLLPARFRLN